MSFFKFNPICCSSVCPWPQIYPDPVAIPCTGRRALSEIVRPSLYHSSLYLSSLPLLVYHSLHPICLRSASVRSWRDLRPLASVSQCPAGVIMMDGVISRGAFRWGVSPTVLSLGFNAFLIEFTLQTYVLQWQQGTRTNHCSEAGNGTGRGVRVPCKDLASLVAATLARGCMFGPVCHQMAVRRSSGWYIWRNLRNLLVKNICVISYEFLDLILSAIVRVNALFCSYYSPIEPDQHLVIFHPALPLWQMAWFLFVLLLVTTQHVTTSTKCCIMSPLWCNNYCSVCGAMPVKAGGNMAFNNDNTDKIKIKIKW